LLGREATGFDRTLGGLAVLSIRSSVNPLSRAHRVSVLALLPVAAV
jgi:hypothetical protein